MRTKWFKHIAIQYCSGASPTKRVPVIRNHGWCECSNRQPKWTKERLTQKRPQNDRSPFKQNCPLAEAARISRQVDLQGVFVKSVILLILRVCLWNSWRTGSLERIKTPRGWPEKSTFLSLTFYNAPSLHAVEKNRLTFGQELGDGDATKQESVKRSAFSLKDAKAFS